MTIHFGYGQTQLFIQYQIGPWSRDAPENTFLFTLYPVCIASLRQVRDQDTWASMIPCYGLDRIA